MIGLVMALIITGAAEPARAPGANQLASPAISTRFCHNALPGEDDKTCFERRAIQASETQAEIAVQSAQLAWRQYLLGLAQAIATILSVLFTGWAALSAAKAAKGADESAKVASEMTATAKEANSLAREALNADQRPWLSIQAIIIGRMKPGKTHLGASGFYVTVRVIVKNYGKAPATDVATFTYLTCFGPKMDNHPDFCIQEAMAMSRSTQESWRPETPHGHVLFSGEDKVTDHLVFISNEEISRSMEGRDFKAFTPYISACVNYGSQHVEGIRQTAISTILTRVGSNGSAEVLIVDDGDWWDHPIALPSTPKTVAT